MAFDRLQPVEAERTLTFAMLQSKAVRAEFIQSACEPKHFFDRTMGELAATIVEVHEAGLDTVDADLLARARVARC